MVSIPRRLLLKLCNFTSLENLAFKRPHHCKNEVIISSTYCLLTALFKTRFYLFVLLLQAVSLANLLLGLGLALGLANLQNQLNDQLGNNNAQPMNMTVVLPNAGTAGNVGPTMPPIAVLPGGTMGKDDFKANLQE